MKKNTKTEAVEHSLNPTDLKKRGILHELFTNAPIPNEELFSNIGLFIDRRNISRILWINELYSQITELHGNIIEFGTRFGANLSLFTSFRGIYEPYNYNRKIIAFDTFEGFPELDKKDKNVTLKSNVGDYAVPENYELFLEEVLQTHESFAPLAEIKKFALIKGDATITITNFFKDHPETIISLAYFDFDIYKPTKVCLEAILPYITKGTIIAFDEINFPGFPGETIALREVLGSNKFKIRHSKFRANAGYLIYE